MKTIIYCYGDGHPLVLGGENLTDADRQAIRAHKLMHQKSSPESANLSAVLHQMEHGEASDILAGEITRPDAVRDLCWCRDQIREVLKSLS